MSRHCEACIIVLAARGSTAWRYGVRFLRAVWALVDVAIREISVCGNAIGESMLIVARRRRRNLSPVRNDVLAGSSWLRVVS